MEVTSLDRSRLSDAVEVLSKAFVNDPLANYVMEVSNVSLEESLNELFLFSCEVRLLLDWPLLGVYVENRKLAGVAGVTLPGDVEWPPSLQEVYADLRTRIGKQSVLRLEAYSRLADINRPSQPHHQLGMIGVDPEHQGRGCGTQLLHTLIELSEAHPESTGIWLDTENPRNLPYYQRFGYEIKAHSMQGKIDIWGMFRPNQKG